MPRKHPEEFRRCAVELANRFDENGERLMALGQSAKDLFLDLGDHIFEPRSVDRACRWWFGSAYEESGRRYAVEITEGFE